MMESSHFPPVKNLSERNSKSSFENQPKIRTETLDERETGDSHFPGERRATSKLTVTSKECQDKLSESKTFLTGKQYWQPSKNGEIKKLKNNSSQQNSKSYFLSSQLESKGANLLPKTASLFRNLEELNGNVAPLVEFEEVTIFRGNHRRENSKKKKNIGKAKKHVGLLKSFNSYFHLRSSLFKGSFGNRDKEIPSCPSEHFEAIQTAHVDNAQHEHKDEAENPKAAKTKSQKLKCDKKWRFFSKRGTSRKRALSGTKGTGNASTATAYKETKDKITRKEKLLKGDCQEPSLKMDIKRSPSMDSHLKGNVLKESSKLSGETKSWRHGSSYSKLGDDKSSTLLDGPRSGQIPIEPSLERMRRNLAKKLAAVPKVSSATSGCSHSVATGSKRASAVSLQVPQASPNQLGHESVQSRHKKKDTLPSKVDSKSSGTQYFDLSPNASCEGTSSKKIQRNASPSMVAALQSVKNKTTLDPSRSKQTKWNPLRHPDSSSSLTPPGKEGTKKNSSWKFFHPVARTLPKESVKNPKKPTRNSKDMEVLTKAGSNISTSAAESKVAARTEMVFPKGAPSKEVFPKCTGFKKGKKSNVGSIEKMSPPETKGNNKTHERNKSIPEDPNEIAKTENFEGEKSKKTFTKSSLFKRKKKTNIDSVKKASSGEKNAINKTNEKQEGKPEEQNKILTKTRSEVKERKLKRKRDHGQFDIPRMGRSSEVVPTATISKKTASKKRRVRRWWGMSYSGSKVSLNRNFEGTLRASSETSTSATGDQNFLKMPDKTYPDGYRVIKQKRHFFH